MFKFSKNQENNGPPIRLLYKNNHYASVMSDGGGDLFDFEGIKLGELQKQMVYLNDPSMIRKSKELQSRIESKENLSNLDSDMREKIEQSIALKESEKVYIYTILYFKIEK